MFLTRHKTRLMLDWYMNRLNAFIQFRYDLNTSHTQCVSDIDLTHLRDSDTAYTHSMFNCISDINLKQFCDCDTTQTYTSHPRLIKHISTQLTHPSSHLANPKAQVVEPGEVYLDLSQTSVTQSQLPNITTNLNFTGPRLPPETTKNHHLIYMLKE